MIIGHWILEAGYAEELFYSCFKKLAKAKSSHVYRSVQRTRYPFESFAFLAIAISCLGLFGPASFMTELRTKERRVWGKRKNKMETGGRRPDSGLGYTVPD